MHHADDEVRRHVVGVVPAPELEVGDVGEVEGGAEDGPEAQDAAAARGGEVEADDAHEGVVHAVEDGGAGAEVVELLGGGEVAHVEDGAEDPRGHAEVGEQLVVAAHGVVGGHALTQAGEAHLVGEEVAEAEEDGEGLLHAEHADEGPLAVELGDGLPGCETAARGDVLARVVAFLRARPEEESVVEGYITRRRTEGERGNSGATSWSWSSFGLWLGKDEEEKIKRTYGSWVVVRIAILTPAHL